MPLIDTDKLGKAVVDEAGEVILPRIEKALEATALQVVDGLKHLLVGRTITFTIKID